ncbi:hypothetical protein Csa_008492 [Cucumis sativus]|uniref:Uncharacterized protein n=1 Tax=Cucumis sativus TaxID=3659 RepID=A0A0A0KSG9_CUCSA|nr:hypothetical protein Csa_008492 [Cucumis sativus]
MVNDLRLPKPCGYKKATAFPTRRLRIATLQHLFNLKRSKVKGSKSSTCLTGTSQTPTTCIKIGAQMTRSNNPIGIRQIS